MSIGWMDLDDQQQVLHEVAKFLQATPSHLVLGLQMLHQLVTEMNSAANTRSLAQHRKVAGSFRDACLFAIFKISLETLHDDCDGIYEGQPNCTRVVAKMATLGFRPSGQFRCDQKRYFTQGSGCEANVRFVGTDAPPPAARGGPLPARRVKARGQSEQRLQRRQRMVDMAVGRR